MTPLIALGETLAPKVRIDDNGCWIWTGYCNSGGYGRIYVGGNKYESLHRLAYIGAHGSIPDGTEIDHLCRNTSCCNPDHLEAVTHAENIRRGSQNRKRPTPKTHCKRGHELTPDNIKGRQCRRCVNDLQNERAKAKRREKALVTVGVLADDDGSDGTDDDAEPEEATG